MNEVYWIAITILIYVFIGYPVLIKLLGRSKKEFKCDENHLPSVSLIVCAYNEEKVIAEKIENGLACNYPQDKYDIIVVSDGSSDRTNEIAQKYNDPKLKFIAYSERGGKVKALNTAFEHASGEVIVLTDANVTFEPDAIRKLVGCFINDKVGAVVGNVILRSGDGSVAGESIYSRYEKAIHTAEGDWSTLITVDGAMYAVRRDYIEPVPLDIITDDWYIACRALLHKKNIVYQPDAVGYELAVASVSGEYKRKVRMIAGGFQMASYLARLFLNPVLFPKIACMFVSHKLLRWLASFFMLGLYISNIYLFNSGEWLYKITFGAQTLFYLLAILGWMFKKTTSNFVVYIPYYFMAVNMASIHGLFRFLTGSQKVTWTISRD